MVIRPRLNLNNGPRNWSANLRTNINILYASGSALLNHKIHSFVRRDNFSIKSRPICHIPPVNKPFRFAAKCFADVFVPSPGAGTRAPMVYRWGGSPNTMQLFAPLVQLPHFRTICQALSQIPKSVSGKSLRRSNLRFVHLKYANFWHKDPTIT
jgi:hypothetical protein